MKKDYENAKMIFFDFDDTVCIHKDSIDDFYKKCIEDPDHVYDETTSPNKPLFDWLNRKLNVPMYCLTWVNLSLVDKPKSGYISKRLQGKDIKLIMTSTPEGKIEVMKLIANSNRVQYSDVLLIDDLYSTNECARSNGFMAVTPQQIMNDMYVEVLQKLEAK